MQTLKFKDEILNKVRKARPLGANNAFTLIELLVVIAIIGILIALGVVSWTAAVSRNRDTTRKTDLQRYKQVLQQYYNDYRAYPIFDIVGSPSIYAANWQLESNPTCTHTNTGPRLTENSKYLAKLPKDPNDGTDYNASCEALRDNQRNRYLYISGPTDLTAGPSKSPVSFALLTTLEHPGSDAITENSVDNPFTQTSTLFGTWYENQNLYGSVLNANYIVTNQN